MMLATIYFPPYTKNGRRDNAVKIVREWTGKEIRYPNETDKINHFPSNPERQCFLLDKDNRVVMVSNPSLNSGIWTLLLSILLMSCSRTFSDPLKHFERSPVVKITPSKIINLEEFEILQPFHIIQIDDSMFVIQDLKSEKIFNLINLSSKKVISGVNKGQGPNEVNSPSCILFRNHKIFIWDAIPKKMSELVHSSDSNLTIKEFFTVDTETPILFFINLLDSTFIANGIFEDFWLAEMNKEGEIISTIDYPIRDETKDLPKILLPALFSSVKMANSPDNKKVVVVTGSQEIISLINRTDSGIKEYKQIKYLPPKISITPTGIAAFTSDNTKGFGGVDCDDQYIYTIYSGKTYNTHPTSANYCEHLLVYDWDGNPVKYYKLDIPMWSMIFDRKKNSIYGIAYNPEGVFVEYQL